MRQAALAIGGLLGAALLLAAAAPVAPRLGSDEAARLEPRLEARLEERNGTSRSVRIVSLDADGIAFRGLDGPELAVPTRLRFDELRAVEGVEVPPGSLERGARLWRALARLERGEPALARPLLEALAAEAAEDPGGFGPATRRLVAEGLLRARIHAGDLGGAAVAALEAMRLDREGIALDPAAVTPAPRIELLDWPRDVPLVPLEWSLTPDARAAVAAALAAFEPTVVATEAGLVRSAILGDEAPLRVGGEDTPLRRALAEVAALRAMTPEEAFAGRDARLQGVDPAVARWLHGQIGERLLAGGDPATRRRGILEWLCIPARFGGEVGGDLALLRAATILRGEGETRLADRLAPDAAASPRAEGVTR